MSKKNSVQDDELKGGKIELEDELFRKFNDIIESDEKIVCGFKPVRSRVFVSNIFCPFMFFLLIAVAMLLMLWLDSEIEKSEAIVGTCVVCGVFVLLFGIIFWFTALYFKNTYYVYTNKRIIIRTGVFGVDFHSLDIQNIGASEVKVSLIDKLLRKNTGSIKFGSNASPINAERSTNYGFLYVENPYQVHRQIKEYIKSIQEQFHHKGEF